MHGPMRWIAAALAILAMLAAGCAQQQTSPNPDAWQNDPAGRQSTTSGGGGK